jgi:hypothetical protein
MTIREFETLIEQDGPPDELTPELKAMWYDRKGDWMAAHELVQDEGTEESAWVHAYLHRKEGDLQNAGYWYRRCGRPVCSDTLEREWARITQALL